LPSVLPSKESTPTFNPLNLPKLPQKDTSDKITEEEQKSPQTTVIRSTNTSDASCHTPPMVPNEQLAQTTTQVAMTVDTGSGNSSLSASCAEHTEHVSTIVSGYEKQAITTAVNPVTIMFESTTTAELSGIQLHPKRRILKSCYNESKTSDNSSATNVTAVETNLCNTISEPATFTNYYQIFLNIRKQVSWLNNNTFSTIFEFLFVYVYHCYLFMFCRFMRDVQVCFLCN